MKTCASCGESGNPDDAKFCASCGTPMIDATAATAAETTAAETSDAGQESFDPIDPVPPVPATAGPSEDLYASAPNGLPNRESRYWAIAAHASALVGGFMGGVPAFLGPLVVWLVRKDEDAWSAGHGRDALNFNLSVLAYALGLLLISIVTFGIGLLIAIPGWIFLALGWFAMTLVGAIRAAGDRPWRYPLTIRFVK